MLRITPSNPLEKEEDRFIYMQDDDGERDKRGIGPLKVYAMANATGESVEKRA